MSQPQQQYQFYATLPRQAQLLVQQRVMQQPAAAAADLAYSLAVHCQGCCQERLAICCLCSLLLLLLLLRMMVTMTHRPSLTAVACIQLCCLWMQMTWLSCLECSLLSAAVPLLRQAAACFPPSAS